MKRRFLLPLLLLGLMLSACGQAAPPDTADPAPVSVATALPEEQPQADPIRISLPADSFSLAETTSLEYQIINDSGDTLRLSPIPLLETKTADGWQKVEFGDVGFCGTHDSLGTSWDDVLDLNWFDALTPGEYRLTRSVYKSGLSTDGKPIAEPTATFTFTA